MKPDAFYSRILMPGLQVVEQVCGIRVSEDAARLSLAIALQESRCEHRYQVGSSPDRPGPARGPFQFEMGGGVRGVMLHPSSSNKAQDLCKHYDVEWSQAPIWRALEGHDGLAVGFARLLLWTDPKPLPKLRDDGWAYYIRNWRPGKPHPSTWPGHWKTASELVYPE